MLSAEDRESHAVSVIVPAKVSGAITVIRSAAFLAAHENRSMENSMSEIFFR
jgi:hypothetical protein